MSKIRHGFILSVWFLFFKSRSGNEQSIKISLRQIFFYDKLLHKWYQEVYKHLSLLYRRLLRVYASRLRYAVLQLSPLHLSRYYTFGNLDFEDLLLQCCNAWQCVPNLAMFSAFVQLLCESLKIILKPSSKFLRELTLHCTHFSFILKRNTCTENTFQKHEKTFKKIFNNQFDPKRVVELNNQFQCY